jgi:hypothetical protein
MNAAPAAPQIELAVFVSLLSVLLWSAWFGGSFRNRQMSVWSLLVLLTVLAITWAIAANWKMFG